MSELRHSHSAVLSWLWLVIGMVFCMVVVGGVTRLTGSGLSIVEWKPIMGVIPPLDEASWNAAFDQYKAYPEFQIRNSSMNLEEFKGIFFWEYAHRLLGRLIGVAFLLPFLWFWWRGCFERSLSWRLLVALGLGGLQGTVGWFMVKSGLVDEPRVSHYRLTAHLGIAFIIMAYLLWLVLRLSTERSSARWQQRPRVLLWCVAALALLQIVYGAFVAGLRAGWGYNTFPRMGESWVPDAVFSMQPLWHNLVENHATVQFLHRWIGTVLLFAVVLLWWRVRSGRFSHPQRLSVAALFVLMLVQYFLGVYTLVQVVPLVPAVAHQGCASLVVLAIVWVFHSFGYGAGNKVVQRAN